MKKFLFIIIFLWMASASQAFAAIAFDVATSGSKGTGGTSGTLTISHAGGSGTQRIAFVSIAYSNRNSSSPSITGVTYDGVSMTAMGAAVTQGTQIGRVYYLIAPATGTKSVIISYSASASANDPISAIVSTYTGVDQTTGFHNYTTNNGGSQNPNLTITSASGELALDMVSAGDSGTQALSVGAGMTSRGILQFTVNGTPQHLGMSESAGAASVSKSWSIATSSMNWVDLGWSVLVGDTTPPTITNISSDKANGTYGLGEVIDIDVTFSEAVTSTGNVTVTLETGATDRTCTFTVSSATTGTCNYTVQSGDTSSDLDATISGTIADQASNAMSNFTPSTGLAANKALVIDTTAPSATGTPDMTSGTDSGTSSTDNITSDTTPDFTMSCESGATVTLAEGVTSLGTGTCSGSTVTITSSALSQAGHTIKAYQTDVALNVSADSSTLSVTIDATSPSAPGTPDMTSGTDSGSSSTDNTTSDTTPDFTISCESSATVTLAEGVTTLGTGTCSSSTVTITSSALSQTGHTIKAFQTDPAGNISSDSSTLSITIDATAPSAPGTPDMTSGTDSGTSSTDNITNDTTPDFTISCESAATVTLAEGVTSLGTGTCSGSTVTITSSALSQTSHTIKSFQTDVAGNVSSDSSTLSVTIDATAPVFSSVLPTSSSTIDNVTTASDISFTTDEALATGSITITRTSGTADASSPHTCTLKGTGLNTGAHTINLSDTTNGCTSDVSNLVNSTVYTFVFAGTDTAGNTATSVTRTSVTAVFDSSAPVISNGSPSGSLPLGTTSTTLSVTTDENATCKYGTVANTAYASIASTFNTTGTTTHSQSISGLSNNGSYTYYIRCIDGFSNANTSDYTISFTVASSAGGSGGLSGDGASSNPTLPPPSTPPTETLPPPTETPTQPPIQTPTTDGCNGRTTGFNTTNGSPCGPTTTTPPTQPPVVSPPSAIPPALTTNITKTSSKSAVMKLQTALNLTLGKNLKVPLVVDGDWGPKTTTAIKLFQRLHNLVPDGIVGPKTRAVMNVVISLAGR